MKKHNLIRKKKWEAHVETKHTYNLRYRSVQFSVGDLSWKKEYHLRDVSNNSSAKFASKFSGPYTIHKKLEINT